MTFNDFIENEDGSCTCRLDLTSEETRQLLEYAVIDLLRKHVQSEEYLRTPVTEDKS